MKNIHFYNSEYRKFTEGLEKQVIVTIRKKQVNSPWFSSWDRMSFKIDLSPKEQKNRQ
jgi:hypothetical protein